MKRKQGQSHARTQKQKYSERELKKKNGGARAGCTCVKAGLEPGLLLPPRRVSLTAGAEPVVACVCSMTACCCSSRGKLERCDHVCHITDSPFPCTCSSVECVPKINYTENL